MNGLWDFALLSFASLFVIVDPIALIPTFLAMTQRNSVRQKVRMAGMACMVAFFVLLVFFFAGHWIFKIFSITMPAFQIGGGILLMLVALDMLRGHRIPVKASPEEEEEGMEKNDIAITPLGVPLLAGPGAITTVLLFSHPSSDVLLRFGIVLMNIFLVSAISFLILWFVAVRSASISVIAMRITTRLMGLLLLAISVQFILNGIGTFITGLHV